MSESLFAGLSAAPTVTPEKEAKRADTRRTYDAHFGVVNHPLKEGQQPSTFAIILGLSRRDQEQLKAAEIKTYGQNGIDFSEPWKFRTFAGDSKFQGVEWQKGIGTPAAPSLALCKGPGGMVKPCINEVYAKRAAEDAVVSTLGQRLTWTASGYESKKNNLTMIVTPDEEAVFYGNPTYVLNQAFYENWPDVHFDRKKAAPPLLRERPAAALTNSATTRRSFCQTAIRAGPCAPISCRPLRTSRNSRQHKGLSCLGPFRARCPISRDYLASSVDASYASSS